MSPGISCRTFCNRLKCYYYKEQESYGKQTQLVINSTLKKYVNSNESIFKIFTKKFTKRSYTGNRIIYASHREFFQRYAASCLVNIANLIRKFSIEKQQIQISYNYKWKIFGIIDCVIPRLNLNVSFSYYDITRTKKDLDFFSLNNYIYNQATNNSNDLLVMSTPTGSFQLIKYQPEAYTIARGFISIAKKNKMKRQGEHCNTCQNKCKGLFYRDLEILELHHGRNS